MDLAIPNGLFDLLKNVTIAVLRERPLDLYEFVADFVVKMRDSRRAAAVGPSSPPASPGSYPSGGDTCPAASVPFYIVVEDDGMAVEPDPATFKPKIRRHSRNGRRGSVSAERYDPEEDAAASDSSQWAVYPKTPEQEERLTEAVKDILLFRSLDTELMRQVISAMFERKVSPGEHVIRQGDDGDNFYVIESGFYDVIISKDGQGEGHRVLQFDGKGSFGELALMYNMPRAASVVAVTAGTLWAMDRKSFRRIVLQSAFRKRKMYEDLLQKVPLLENLDAYERMTLSDALISKTHDDTECIIREGDDQAEGMYFIESGEARVTIVEKGEEREVCRITTGGYFGEMALLEKSPRSASVYAHGRVKTAFLERESFERLLGPCLEVMKRKSLAYKKSSSIN